MTMAPLEKSSGLISPHQDEFSNKSRTKRWRAYLAMLLTILLFTIIKPFASRAALALPSHQCAKLTLEQRATKILSENPLIDGHNDLLIMLRFVYKNQIYNGTFQDRFEKGGLEQHVDIPRMEKGQYGGAFWSLFMPCPRITDMSDESYAPIVKATLEQIDTYQRLSTLYPKYFTLASDSSDAIKQFDAGNLISPTGIEGLHQIGNSISTLRLYHSLGVRYSTLTWNCHNVYADAALVSEDGETVASKPLWHGISTAGDLLIKEMNRLGMLVDLSHVSKDTMIDVLGGNSSKTSGSLAPPIFSHSSAYSICPHPRNVPDDVLQLVKKKNSLVMVNFSPDFISCTSGKASTGLPDYHPANNTLAQVVRHITHIGDLIGYDHVGIGTDYDGIENTPKGLEDVSKFPDLVKALLEAGVSDADAGKVVGRNLLRVWKEVDDVSAKLKKTMLPLEDDIVPYMV